MDNDISKVLYIATKLYEKFIPLLTTVPLVLFDDEDLENFAKENNLTLDITYKETTDVEENIVLSQGRDPGDPIYNGYTLKITISKKPEDKTEPTDSLMPKDDKKDKKTE